MREFTVEKLENIVAEYPWYYDARILLASETDKNADPVLKLHFTGRPLPGILLDGPSQSDFFKTSVTEEVIDKFLARGTERVQPPENKGNEQSEDLSADSVSEDTELYTEELAEIYLLQGLRSKARNIYAKLSLLYPEKSIYFAELIERIDTE